MAIQPHVIDDAATQPLVSCSGCGFAWYGRTAAHGLSVIGHCPRCRGALRFHDHTAALERGETGAADVPPWRVLGTPTSWAGS